MAATDPDAHGGAALSRALQRAHGLDEALMRAIGAAHFHPFDDSGRIGASVSAAQVALEHGRALRVLVADGLPTSALSLMRLQHEALVRALWLLYAASDLAIDTLSVPLSKETESAARSLPMMAEMLKQLGQKPAAAQALIGLQAFKDNNAATLNSFVHSGIHALQRQAQGYPAPLIVGALRNCNGLMVMTAMMLAVLTGRQALVHAVSQLQATFVDDLPPVFPPAPPGHEQAPAVTPARVATQDFKNSST